MALLWVLAMVQPAAAADHSVSHSLWVVSGGSVMLRYTLPRSAAQQLVAPGWPRPTDASVGRYVLDHMSVYAGANRCPAIDQGYDLGNVDPLNVGPDLYGFEIMFRCTQQTGLVLHDGAMFDKTPGHTDFAFVQLNGGGLIRRLVTAQTQRLQIPTDGSLRTSGIGSYLRTGFWHFLFGFDHVCFVCGLLLLVRRWRAFGLMGAGLVLGYGAAAAVDAAGLITARSGAAEAWIGFMVLGVAVLIIARETERPVRLSLVAAGGLLLLAAAAALSRHFTVAVMTLSAAVLIGSLLRLLPTIANRSVLWVALTAAFGFLDGFTLPADVDTLQVPSLLPAFAVLGFNAGAALAAMLVAALLIAAVALLHRAYRMRPGLFATDVSASVLAGLGTFWFLTRLNL
jgi:hypothetical protein